MMDNFSWQPRNYVEDKPLVERLEPDDVLYEIDEPTTFTVKSNSGALLAHWCDQSGGIRRFVLSPTSRNIIIDLGSGQKSIVDALDQPWVWIIDVDISYNVVRSLRTSIDDIPPGILPARNVMLSPDLEPAFVLKLAGHELSHDFIPASVIRRAVDGAYGALKKMTEKVLEAGTPTGRPADSIREIFDLPMQRMARGSFEVAFGMPRPRQGLLGFAQTYSECLNDIGGEMSTALRWARSEGNGTSLVVPSIQLLEAIEKLAPPKHGLVERTYISGSLFNGKSYVLTRDSSDKIRKTLNRMRADEEVIVQLSGKVREFDKDKYSFMLRETHDGQEHKCVVPEELYDAAYDAFHSDALVKIVAIKTNLKPFMEIVALTEA